jgi:hypothetical protein
MPVYPSAFLDHLVRAQQYVRWNRETDLVSSLQIDDQVELLRLLDGEIAGLGAF